MAKRKKKKAAAVPPGHALLTVPMGNGSLDILVLKPGLRELTIVYESMPARPEPNPQKVENIGAERAHHLELGIGMMKLVAVKPRIVEDDELVDGQLPAGAIHLRDLGISGGNSLSTQINDLCGFTEAVKKVDPLSSRRAR